MGQTHYPPFATEGGQPAQQKPTEPPSFFDLAKHRFYNDLASRIQGLAGRRAHFRRHALLRRGGWGACLGLRRMMPLTCGRDGWIEPYTLQRLHRSLTVIATVQGRRDSLGGARLTLGACNTSLGQSGQRGLRQRLRLLLVVRRGGHVTGQDNLTCRVHARVRIATVVPALIVRAPDMQLGIRTVTLSLGVGGLSHRLEGFATVWFARPLALRVCCGSRAALHPPLLLSPCAAARRCRSTSASALACASKRRIAASSCPKRSSRRANSAGSSSPRRLPRAASSSASCWEACVTKASISSRRRSTAFCLYP